MNFIFLDCRQYHQEKARLEKAIEIEIPELLKLVVQVKLTPARQLGDDSLNLQGQVVKVAVAHVSGGGGGSGSGGGGGGDGLGCSCWVYLMYPPFLDLSPGSRGLNISGTLGHGQAWDVLAALTGHFNFTPRVVVAPTGGVGAVGLTGEWDGEAEFSLLPVALTEARQAVLEFTAPLGTSSYGALVRRPGFSPKPDALLQPFDLKVWLVIVATLVMMGPLMYAVILTGVRLGRRDASSTHAFTLTQCVWFVYGALMKQGSTLKPLTDSSRILFATWWVYVVIVTSFYTANLTAFMTFNGLKLPVSSAAQLAQYPAVSWLALPDGALQQYVQ
ncbi:Ionotropic receptor 76b, partial [Hyalella azteca]